MMCPDARQIVSTMLRMLASLAETDEEFRPTASLAGDLHPCKGPSLSAIRLLQVLAERAHPYWQCLLLACQIVTNGFALKVCAVPSAQKLLPAGCFALGN